MKAKTINTLFSATKTLQVIFAFLLVICYVTAFGQAEMPYSHYGLGYIRSPVFSSNSGMGYLEAPFASAVNINAANPASYASLTRTTIEVGFLVDGSGISNKDSSYRAASGSVNHLAIAFVPNSKHNNWALSIGLLPYSYVDYNFAKSYSDSALGRYTQLYSGSGSLYQVYVGAAFKIKGLSIGANLGYVFGKLQYQKIVAFDDTLNNYDTRNITNLNVKSFTYKIGVQYQKLIYHNHDNPDTRKDIYLFAGADGSGGAKMNASVSNYWDRFHHDLNGNLVVIDTLQSTFNQKGKIILPFNLGAGIMFGNERYWLLGADFKYMNWSSYSTPLDNGGLSNSWQISLGAQLTPKYDDRNFLNRIQYRIGAYYGKSEVSVQGYNLSQAGATLGLGLPLKNIAHINIAGDFGSIGGSPDRSVFSESFYRVTFGIVLNDIWFVKRKFD